jgi:alkyl sulfatase BDS1-like metallo-beta-lactamase superfamily hydrolase
MATGAPRGLWPANLVNDLVAAQARNGLLRRLVTWAVPQLSYGTSSHVAR